MLFAIAVLGAACSETKPTEVPTPANDAGLPITPGDDASVTTHDDAAVIEPEDDAGVITPEDDAGTEPILDSGTAVPSYTWWGEVRAIVHDKCLLCHTRPPQFGAPRPFVDWADTQQTTNMNVPVHEMMAFRINAPQNAMPPPGQPQLTREEREILRIWSENGAPEGTPPADGGVPEDSGTDDAGETGSDAGMLPDAGASTRTLDIVAHNANSTDPYDIPVRTTQYLCWSLTVPPTMSAEEYAYAFEPLIVNSTHLHHLLLFKNTAGDAQDGPFDCESWDLQWDLIGGWAPGRGTEVMPAGVGVKLEAGMQLVVQAHYDSVTAQGQTDQSGFRVHTTDIPGLTEAGMLWSGVSWVNAINGANVDRVGTCTINSPITIFSAFPHMHKLGTRITLEVQRANSATWNTLVDIDPWSFNDQPNILIDPAEQQINAGDKLRTHCWWNTNGNAINFGEASDDEMCFNFIYHYPLMSNQYRCWSIAL